MIPIKPAVPKYKTSKEIAKLYTGKTVNNPDKLRDIVKSAIKYAVWKAVTKERNRIFWGVDAAYRKMHSSERHREKKMFVKFQAVMGLVDESQL